MASSSSSAVEEPFDFDLSRRRVLTAATKPAKDGRCVIYWMSRDQRAEDNWALLYAHYLAAELGGLPVKVCFSLVPKFLEATIRMYGFMIKGLEETEQNLRGKNIPFHLLEGFPQATVPDFVAAQGAAAVVTDMSPLKTPMGWAQGVASKLDEAGDAAIPLFQVDAHNVVPVWVASPKQEYAARTIRPKITGLLGRYMTEFPQLPGNTGAALDQAEMPKEATDWTALRAKLEVDRSVPEVEWLVPGATGGMDTLKTFCATRLKLFDSKRNDPNVNACSHMSPYTHFGQVSAQRAALYVKKHGKSHSKGVANFIEESIVRRELSDNFCFYNENYDNLDGASGWARESLDKHAADNREYVYTEAELEAGTTHDLLWNAAQLQMVKEGKMHGFLRMYWAKKILEWTESPAEALRISLYLNNKYELDGRDPNGYVGCMWSICGTHDMGWKEREVFGKIRFMNYKGCLRKFKVKEFEALYPSTPVAAGKGKQGSVVSMFAKKQKRIKDEGGGGGGGGGAAKRVKSEESK